MIKSAWIYGAAALATISAVTAEEFPLTFKTVPAKDVRAFPGGYGAYTQLRLSKPKELKNEPKAISQHPLYGVTSRNDSGVFIVRLDESKGDGKGYDSILVDMNQNGELTDESAGSRVKLTDEPKVPPGMLRGLFGPFEAPADKAVAGSRPLYFAEVQTYNTQMLKSGANNANLTFGYVRLKAGWYLEAQVNLGSVSQKVGLFDANTNLKIGDSAKAQTYRSGDEENWYFTAGDSILTDADHSGAFENDAFDRESCPLSSLLYLGSTPYEISVAADCKSLRVEKWKSPLATVKLTPKGEQVQNISLAWEKTKGAWQLIRAGVDGAKIQVPPGSYRLYATTLVGKGAPKDQVMVSGYQRVVQKPFVFSADQANTLKCGAPLDINVAAERKTPESWETSRLPEKQSTDSDYVLSISANVRGAGGEVYSSFGKGEKLADDPPKPAFTVLDSAGKTVANGSLEFG